MGCELGKFAKGSHEDSDKDSNKPPQQNIQPADPRLPLNAKQKYSMLASWKGIARAMGPTGIYMFIKYVYPYNTFFKSTNLLIRHYRI